MESRVLRLGVVVALVAAAVILFVVLSDDDGGEQAKSSTTPATTQAGGGNQEPGITTIVVKDGEPVGGVQDLTYTSGDDVQFSVKSDAAEEVHVHGYDLMQDTVPGGSTTFDFPADIEGIFEVELEESHTQIAELTVEPG
jgi:hypothetical protein